MEWVPRPGAADSGYRKDVTQSHDPQAVVRVARGLVHEGGDKPGPCIVVLGGDLLRQRIYSLGAIPVREQAAVLRRKAANLMEVEERQVIFSALPLATHDGETDFRWLISAIKLSDLRALQEHLWLDGFRAKQFLYGRQSLLRAAEANLSTEADDEAWIIVGAEDAGVSISLVAAGQLVQQSLVPGVFRDNPTMAASVLQEMRGFESYWRRFSRGGAIDDVFVAGLTNADSDHFELACHAALPNSEFLAVGDEDAQTPEQARALYLHACTQGQGLAGDFSLPAPVRRKGLLAAAALTLCVGMLLGREVQTRLTHKAEAKRTHTEWIGGEIPDLAQIESDLDRMQARRAELALRGELASVVGSAGLELGDWLSITRQAFDGRAVLESIHFDDNGGEASLAVGGRVSADPTESTLALAGISEALRSVPELTQFKLRLPTTVNGTSTGREGLEFRVTAAIQAPTPSIREVSQ